METMTQRRVSVAETGIQRPAGVPTSAFDIAKQPAANKPTAPKSRLDLATIIVRKDVPLPDNTRGASAVSPYKVFLDKMQPGDSVQLIPRHARGLVAHAKKVNVKTALRTLEDGLAGVWRL